MRKRKIIFYIIAVLLLTTVVIGTLHLISRNVALFSNRILQKIADEKALSVNRELAFLKREILLQARDSLLVASNSPFAYPIGTATAGKRLYIDLQKLNRYFIERNESSPAYFELFNERGRCLISPEPTKVGRYTNLKRFSALNKNGHKILSDYLQIDVFASAYNSEELFRGSKIITYVPYIVTQDEVKTLTNTSMLLGIGAMMIVFLLLFISFYEQRTIQRLKMESLRQANHVVQAQLVQLKEQINPHFLFNTLGSLQHLIGKDDQLAKVFVSKMTKVYRKMLHTDHSGWSPVNEELDLAQSYFFLQKTRFGAGLHALQVDLEGLSPHGRIPRLALQILVENAIKHTRFSQEHPLQIKIVYDPTHAVLEVTNAFGQQSHPETEGEGYGLRYLKALYASERIKGFEFGVRSTVFYVSLPIFTR